METLPISCVYINDGEKRFRGGTGTMCTKLAVFTFSSETQSKRFQNILPVELWGEYWEGI